MPAAKPKPKAKVKSGVQTKVRTKSKARIQPKPEAQPVAVLTLAEAARYLRVKESDLGEMAERNEVPAQKIAQEWRFLREALEYWLTARPYTNKFLEQLKEQLVQDLRLAMPSGPKPGSKEAVLSTFGVFDDDDDLEEQLAYIKAFREKYA